MKRAIMIAVAAASMTFASCGGEPPVDDDTVPTSEGLPGQGGHPCCKYHPGGFSVNTQACGNGVSVTSANFQTLCNTSCLPSSYHC